MKLLRYVACVSLLLVCVAGLSAQTLTCSNYTFVDGSGSFSNPAVTVTSSTLGVLILVTLQVDNTTANLGVTDNKGNTYVEDFHGTQSKQLNLWSAVDGFGGVTTITVQTGGFAHGSIGIAQCASTTGWPASHFDKGKDGLSSGLTTGQTWSSTATATTTQAIELWYGVAATTSTLPSPVWTAGSGWTTGSSLTSLHYIETQQVAATGAATATGSLAWTGGGSADFVVVVGTYKPNGAGATGSTISGATKISGATTIK
jgi:hypothetical protein